MKADLLEGFRYIRDTPDVRMLAVIFMGVVLSGFAYQTLMPGYLVNALGPPGHAPRPALQHDSGGRDSGEPRAGIAAARKTRSL
ncbi:hypothetical protein [Candidatus Amarobacter glycogenicus]|uniref:hypothetical protein n=1 Tax=Candidatus Amarobacter glycogenicus TaxID=3140699 RepID=UPI002A1740F4|nr:hypothetical protein [Dehalococcoidia bacterium]